jgi:hypothetical protein
VDVVVRGVLPNQPPRRGAGCRSRGADRRQRPWGILGEPVDRPRHSDPTPPGRAISALHRTLVQLGHDPTPASGALARLLARLEVINAAGIITATPDPAYGSADSPPEGAPRGQHTLDEVVQAARLTTSDPWLRRSTHATSTRGGSPQVPRGPGQPLAAWATALT